MNRDIYCVIERELLQFAENVLPSDHIVINQWAEADPYATKFI